MNAVTNLPDISAALLPATYEAACTALAECSRIDECQDWADKAAALASYAKQADDEQLHKYADRIKARAIRRCGELLKQIPPANGANQNIRGGGAPKVQTRKDAATDAGLSSDQMKQAIRVASVPSEDFNQQVESDDPPTVTELAEQGKRTAEHLGTSSRSEFKAATEALSTLRRFAEFANKTDANAAARGVQPKEVARAREHVAAIDAWLDRFVVSLKE